MLDMRVATLDDFAFVREIFERPENTVRLDSFDAETFGAWIAAPDETALIYETDSPRGYVVLTQIDRDAGVAKINELAVTAPGSGDGRGLLASLVAYLEREGIAEIWLFVVEDNHPARRFYDKAGFTGDGTIKMWTPTKGDPLPVLTLRADVARLREALVASPPAS